MTTRSLGIVGSGAPVLRNESGGGRDGAEGGEISKVLAGTLNPDDLKKKKSTV